MLPGAFTLARWVDWSQIVDPSSVGRRMQERNEQRYPSDTTDPQLPLCSCTKEVALPCGKLTNRWMEAMGNTLSGMMRSRR